LTPTDNIGLRTLLDALAEHQADFALGSRALGQSFRLNGMMLAPLF
jgi:hypothetical protein